MTWRDRARALVRGNAHRWPGLYNARNDYLGLAQRLQRQVHDADYQVFRELSGPSPLIYDVGANVGQSVVSIKHVCPGARVVAFEPFGRAFARCVAVAARFEHVSVLPAACGARSGEVSVLVVPRARGIWFTQHAALDPIGVDEAVALFQHSGYPWVRRSDIELVQVPVVSVALDDLPGTPDAIKIDVEGHELEVLVGAERLLTGRRPPRLLLIERGSRSPILEHLLERGYIVQRDGPINTVFRLHEDRADFGPLAR